MNLVGALDMREGKKVKFEKYGPWILPTLPYTFPLNATKVM
jgi:hypothetical protein